jgi:hypothetical protein
MRARFFLAVHNWHCHLKRSNCTTQEDPSEEEHKEEEEPQVENMANIEVEEEVLFFTCPSQAYQDLVDYHTKEGKKL